MTPGETLYVAMKDIGWHASEHYDKRDYDQLTSREQANFEYLARRVLDEYTDFYADKYEEE